MMHSNDAISLFSTVCTDYFVNCFLCSFALSARSVALMRSRDAASGRRLRAARKRHQRHDEHTFMGDRDSPTVYYSRLSPSLRQIRLEQCEPIQEAQAQPLEKYE